MPDPNPLRDPETRERLLADVKRSAVSAVVGDALELIGELEAREAKLHALFRDLDARPWEGAAHYAHEELPAFVMRVSELFGVPR